MIYKHATGLLCPQVSSVSLETGVRPAETRECGVLRALRIELTPGVGLCGTQPVVGPLRALSRGLKIYDLIMGTSV